MPCPVSSSSGPFDDSGGTVTHAYLLLRGSFNRQLSPEETRGHIEWHGSPSPFFPFRGQLDGQVNPRKDSTDGVGAMPGLFSSESV